MGSVSIGADTFPVYGTSAGLATHANGSSAYYAAYIAAVADDPDDVKRKHVEATGLIALMPFEDAANADVDTAAEAVVKACYELTLAAIVDPTILTATSTGTNIKRLGAGDGVEVEYFGPVAGSRFPSRVMALLGPLLEGAAGGASSGSGGVLVAGTSTCSDFDACDVYGLSRG